MADGRWRMAVMDFRSTFNIPCSTFDIHSHQSINQSIRQSINQSINPSMALIHLHIRISKLRGRQQRFLDRTRVGPAKQVQMASALVVGA